MRTHRLRLLLILLAFCLAFVVAEIGIYRWTRAPISESLQLAGPGPLALAPHNLLDRLNEWRAQTPELWGMMERLIQSSVGWTLFKNAAFPLAVLATLYRERTVRLGLGRAAAGIFAQILALGLPRLVLYAGVLFCAQGLLGANPFVPWALLALLCLLSMLQVSCDLAQVRVFSDASRSPLSLGHAIQALTAWFTAPGTMFPAWLLRIVQIAVAAGPLLDQIKAQPGPNSPRAVLYFVTASFLLWTLRLWMLAQAASGPASRSAPAPEACRSAL